jgi:HTH-like domain
LAQKKVQTTGLVKERVALVENMAGRLSVRQQCELMGIARGAYYYEPRPESAENLAMMRRIDELHLERPVYGSLRLAAQLRREGWKVNRKRVMRLMALMGIDKPAGRRTSDLPVFIAGKGGQWSGPGLVRRYHLHPDALRLHVSGGGDGLVESLRASVALE